MPSIAFHALCLILTMVRRLLCQGVKLALWGTGAYSGPFSRTILLVREDALGDFLISSNALAAYYAHFHQRGYQVILVHSPQVTPLLQHFPWADQTLCAPQKAASFLQHFFFYRKLAKLRPEISVRLSTMFGSDMESLLDCLYSGAQHKAMLRTLPIEYTATQGLDLPVNHPYLSWRQRITTKLFTKRQKLQLTDAWKYQGVLSCFDLQAPAHIGDSVFAQEAQLATLIIGTPVPSRATPPDYIPEAPFPLSTPTYFCLIPGSSNPARRCTAEYYAELIQKLHALHPEVSPILCGVASELPLIDSILQKLPPDFNYINTCGQTTLPQLHSLLKHAQFVISNDTGTAHFAALLSIPLVVLAGGGQYGAYFPAKEYPNAKAISIADHACFHCNWLCHQFTGENFPCVAKIPLTSVLNAVTSIYPTH